MYWVRHESFICKTCLEGNQFHVLYRHVTLSENHSAQFWHN